MCGIAGVLRSDGASPDPSELSRLAAALAHRGPDDEGLHVDGPVGLVHRRLSILDLSAAGHQPMSNEDGTVWVVYNGQLFDFEPLRERLVAQGHRFRSRTDTEILVHLYEERGEGLVEEIDGMFAFALWDARRRRLLLARDRLGIKPLYYVQGGGRFAFASEARALRALADPPDEIDPSGIVHYLYQSSTPAETSVVKGLRQVPPAHVVVVDADGKCGTRRYWSVPRDTAPTIGFEAAAEELHARLGAAVRSHLVADVPVGAFLSGGLDSSAVTLLARRVWEGPFHTFSVRFDGPASYDEGPAAAETAAALGTVHHELRVGDEALDALPAVLSAQDEPFAISSALALHHLARFARAHVKVVLTGDGADEILAGYPWRHEPDWGTGAGLRSRARGLALTVARSARGAAATGPGFAGQLRSRLGRLRHPDERYAELVCAFTPEEMERLLVPDLAPLARAVWDESPIRRAYREEQGPDEVNRRLRTDLRTTLVDEMLTKVDRTTMSAGLEARVPFLDRRMVEWCLRLPGAHKVAGGRGKRVLRRALEAALPAAAARPKHGFDVPLGPWLRARGREWLGDALSPSAVRRRGLVRPEIVERILRTHLAGDRDHSRKLLTLAVLEMWLADRERAPAARPASAPAALAGA
jgi:asparagine synthase (glutamine-hydrolysing)